MRCKIFGHKWKVVGVRAIEPKESVLPFMAMPTTTVLQKCLRCQANESYMLAGIWTQSEVEGNAVDEVAALNRMMGES